MNKAELITAVAQKSGLTRKDADKVVASVLESITETLASGEKVSLVGFDSSIKEVQLLEENILKATVIQQSFKMGYYSIETAVGILSGKQQKSYINSGSMLITNENMYKEDVQKILFPVQ